MDKLHDVGDVFLYALKKMKRSVMFLPAVIAFAMLEASETRFLGVIPALASGDMTQLSGQQDLYGFIYWGSLALMLLAPALVSAMGVVAKEDVEHGAGNWPNFWGGSGKYYWKVVGAYVLFGLATAFFGSGSLGRTGSIALGYFFAPWIAVLVLDGSGVWTAVSCGAKFAWRNPDLLLPVYVLQKGSEYLTGMVPEAFVSWGPDFTTLTLERGWFVGSVLAGAAHGYIFALSMLMYFVIYTLRRPAPAVTEVSPPDPPLGLDESAE